MRYVHERQSKTKKVKALSSEYGFVCEMADLLCFFAVGWMKFGAAVTSFYCPGPYKL